MNRRPANAIIGLVLVAAVWSATVTAGASPPPTAASNLAAAEQDVTGLLAAFVPPPGATLVSSTPAEPTADPVAPNTVDAVSSYVVTGTSAADLLASEKANPPPGSQWAGSQGQTSPSGPSGLTGVWFSWPPQAGVLAQRWLILDAGDMGNGQVSLRVTAQDIWITPRPTWEQIPANVRSLSIVASTIMGPPSVPVFARSPATIAPLIAAANALPIMQPGVYHCPADIGPTIAVHLFAAGSSVPRASLVLGGPCDEVSFTLGSTRGPALVGSAALLARINRLGVIPACRAVQLRRVGRLSPDEVPGGQATFSFANASRRLCLLAGYPQLTLRDREGIRLPVAGRRARAEFASPDDMAPGATASFGATWRTPASKCADPPALATIRLPGKHAGSLEVRVPQHPSQPWPCRGRINIEPFTILP